MLESPLVLARLLTLLKQSKPSDRILDLTLRLLRNLQEDTADFVFTLRNRKKLSLFGGLVKQCVDCKLNPVHPFFVELESYVSHLLKNFESLNCFELTQKAFYDSFTRENIENLVSGILGISLDLMELKKSNKGSESLMKEMKTLFVENVDVSFLKAVIDRPVLFLEAGSEDQQESEENETQLFLANKELGRQTFDQLKRKLYSYQTAHEHWKQRNLKAGYVYLISCDPKQSYPVKSLTASISQKLCQHEDPSTLSLQLDFPVLRALKVFRGSCVMNYAAVLYRLQYFSRDRDLLKIFTHSLKSLKALYKEDSINCFGKQKAVLFQRLMESHLKIKSDSHLKFLKTSITMFKIWVFRSWTSNRLSMRKLNEVIRLLLSGLDLAHPSQRTFIFKFYKSVWLAVFLLGQRPNAGGERDLWLVYSHLKRSIETILIKKFERYWESEQRYKPKERVSGGEKFHKLVLGLSKEFFREFHNRTTGYFEKIDRDVRPTATIPQILKYSGSEEVVGTNLLYVDLFGKLLSSQNSQMSGAFSAILFSEFNQKLRFKDVLNSFTKRAGGRGGGSSDLEHEFYLKLLSLIYDLNFSEKYNLGSFFGQIFVNLASLFESNHLVRFVNLLIRHSAKDQTLLLEFLESALEYVKSLNDPSVIFDSHINLVFDFLNLNEEKDDLRCHPINEYISGEIKPSLHFMTSNRMTVTHMMDSQGHYQATHLKAPTRNTNPNLHQGFQKEDAQVNNPFALKPKTVSRKESFSLKNKLVIMSVLSTLPKSPTTYEMTKTEMGFLSTSNQRYSKFKGIISQIEKFLEMGHTSFESKSLEVSLFCLSLKFLLREQIKIYLGIEHTFIKNFTGLFRFGGLFFQRVDFHGIGSILCFLKNQFIYRTENKEFARDLYTVISDSLAFYWSQLKALGTSIKDFSSIICHDMKVLTAYSIINKDQSAGSFSLPKVSENYLEKFCLRFPFILVRPSFRSFFYLSLHKLYQCGQIDYALVPEIGEHYVLSLPFTGEVVELPFSKSLVRAKQSKLLKLLFKMAIGSHFISNNPNFENVEIASSYPDFEKVTKFGRCLGNYLRLMTISPKISKIKDPSTFEKWLVDSDHFSSKSAKKIEKIFKDEFKLIKKPNEFLRMIQSNFANLDIKTPSKSKNEQKMKKLDLKIFELKNLLDFQKITGFLTGVENLSKQDLRPLLLFFKTNQFGSKFTLIEPLLPKLETVFASEQSRLPSNQMIMDDYGSDRIQNFSNQNISARPMMPFQNRRTNPNR